MQRVGVGVDVDVGEEVRAPGEGVDVDADAGKGEVPREGEVGRRSSKLWSALGERVSGRRQRTKGK